RKLKLSRRVHDLKGMSILVRSVASAQAFLPREDGLQAAAQGWDIQASPHFQKNGEVVAQVLGGAEIVDPQAFLKPGKRALRRTGRILGGQLPPTVRPDETCLVLLGEFFEFGSEGVLGTSKLKLVAFEVDLKLHRLKVIQKFFVTHHYWSLP